jgi:hypothetical protein
MGYKTIRKLVSHVCRERIIWRTFWHNVHTLDRFGQDAFMLLDSNLGNQWMAIPWRDGGRCPELESAPEPGGSLTL